LDDVWHRLFGQDVTLWSPTHLLMLGGGMLALIGEAVLLVEGRKAYEAPEAGSPRLRSWDPPASWDAMNNKIRRTMLGGGILVGLCIFQAEFDYGIPQFRMIFSPMLLMMSASIALVFIRIFAGRFGAIGAVLFYALIRLGLLIFVDPIMGDLASTFPVFWVEAIVVEVAALIVSTKKPVQFAAVAGALIGTFGLAFEYGWSHVFAAYHWDADLFPLAAILGFIAAMAGAQIGAWMGNSLRQRPPIEGAGRHLAAGSFAVILMLIAFGLHEQPVTGLTASVTTTPAKVNKPGRWVNATVKLSDPQATKDAIWIKQIAWQGKPGLETATMREVSPGVLQTTRPMPVSGSWKSGIRIQKGSSVMGMALYYPRDDAIPVAEIPALAAFERGFQPDRQLLQRENKIDGGPLAIASYALLFFLAMLLIGLQAWGIARVGTGRPPTSDEVGGHRAEVRSSRSTTRPSPA
ncbi:MAG: hypothetical protein JHC87_05010, partial [Thermoleophilaceae bacterium]|nr:hypothetical protein [Thermoleophilaceae bacterium]